MKLEESYQILGVTEQADKQAIKKAYKKLALKYHPDKYTDDPVKADAIFKQVSQAYEIAMDPTKAKYDFDSSNNWYDAWYQKANQYYEEEKLTRKQRPLKAMTELSDEDINNQVKDLKSIKIAYFFYINQRLNDFRDEMDYVIAKSIEKGHDFLNSETYIVVLSVQPNQNPAFSYDTDITHPALIELSKIGCSFSTDLKSTIKHEQSTLIVDIPTDIGLSKLDELIQVAEQAFYHAQDSMKRQQSEHVSLSIWHTDSCDEKQEEEQRLNLRSLN